MEENIKKDAKNLALIIDKSFTEYNSIPKWSNYNSVLRFKSVKRAIRRGRVDLISGIIYPNRPFNNRKPTSGRSHNELKKVIYGRLKQLQ